MNEIGNYLDVLFPHFEPGLKQEIIKHGTIRDVKSGENLLQPRQYFKSSVLVIVGRIKLHRHGEDGEEFFMYYLNPGDACALSMICASRNETSELSAKAIEDTKVLTMPIELMDALMKDYKTWYYFVLETYRKRFEELLQVVDGVAFKGLDERLLFYLERQVKEFGIPQLHLTHQEIANDLNSSREVISRLLKKLEQNGKVKLDRNYIEYLS